VAEIRSLGRRAGGVRLLIAPTRRGETEGMTDAQVATFLSEDPKRLRRPIIDTGSEIHLGFTAAVREALAK
jgi:arsenate reductase-like glutaredoxin family protein